MEKIEEGKLLETMRRNIYHFLLQEKLKGHLLMIQEQAEERFELLVEQMVKREGVTGQRRLLRRYISVDTRRFYAYNINGIKIIFWYIKYFVIIK